jgi:site-specific recombinase XerD
MSDLAPLLQRFFTDRLMLQRQASVHTVAAYRDTFRLLLGFVASRTGRQPARLSVTDLDAPMIAAFLEHLQTARGNTTATRNARLAAISSFFRYAALHAPDHAAIIQRVLAIPPKRRDRAIVAYLTDTEIDALLAAPNRTTWLGRRDHTLLLIAVHTGLRAGELTGLRIQDIELGAGAHLRCHGKGRKDRATPLTTTTVTALRTWMIRTRSPRHRSAVRHPPGRPLSHDAVQRLVAKHAATAAAHLPVSARQERHPHTIAALHRDDLLRAGVDLYRDRLWLGHESTETTQIYLHADMTINEQALARVAPTDSSPGRYKAPDTLLAFLADL